MNEERKEVPRDLSWRVLSSEPEERKSAIFNVTPDEMFGMIAAKLFFIDSYTLPEIAGEMNLSVDQISDILAPYFLSTKPLNTISNRILYDNTN